MNAAELPDEQSWRGRTGAGSRNENERGAGSILLLGVVAACVTVSLLVIPIYRGAVTKRLVANAADAAALAAADVAIGIVPGVPCEVASAAALLNGARLSECVLSGAVATVAVESSMLGLRVGARARAGPPGSHEEPDTGQ